MEMDTDVLRSSYLADQANNRLGIHQQANCLEATYHQDHHDRHHVIGPNVNNSFTNQDESLVFRSMFPEFQSSSVDFDHKQTIHFDRDQHIFQVPQDMKDCNDNVTEKPYRHFDDIRGVPRESLVGTSDEFKVSGMWSSSSKVKEPVSYITHSDYEHPPRSNSGHPLTSLFQYCDSLDLNSRNYGNKLAETWKNPIVFDSQDKSSNVFPTVYSKTSIQNISGKPLHYAPPHSDRRASVEARQKYGQIQSRSWHRPHQFLAKKNLPLLQKNPVFDVSLSRRTRDASPTDSSSKMYNKENNPISSLTNETATDNAGIASVRDSENSSFDSSYISLIKSAFPQHPEGAKSTETSPVPYTFELSYCNRSKVGRYTESEKTRRRKYILDSVGTVELESLGIATSSSQEPDSYRVEEYRRDEDATEVSLHSSISPLHDSRMSSSLYVGSPEVEAVANVPTQDSLTDFYDLINALDKSPKKIPSNLSLKFPVLKSALGRSNAGCPATSESSVLENSPSVSVNCFSMQGSAMKMFRCGYCKRDIRRRALKRHMQQLYRCECGRGFCLLEMLTKHKKTCSEYDTSTQ